ncbi:MAG: beta-lactamase family protein [Clostridia bacterium]|nr:beta-lactamase family protein [Clostridia bacterium]
MFEQTKALCQHFLNIGITGFDLIVYKDGKCILRHMGGYSDPENKIPMKGNEKYHIYSCSKLITCVAAMQLWEKGMFCLEDDLSSYMPAFSEMTVKTESGIQKAKKPIKIHHLFEMTSGMNYDLQTPNLQEYYGRGDNPCPTVELVNHLAKTPLSFEPGEGWQYSLSHDVIAALVEVLTGENLKNM